MPTATEPNYLYRSEKNILLEKYQAIYIFIPKVASTSIKKVIAEALNIPSPNPSRPEGFVHARNYPFSQKSDLLTKYKNYFKFCFIRNPFDRIVSCYSNKITQDKDHSDMFHTRGVSKAFANRYGNLFQANMSFDEFVLRVSEIPDSQADAHFQSQWLRTVDKKGQSLTNFIGRFETLQEDFKYVCDTIGFPWKNLPELMKSSHHCYKDHYCKKTIRLIEERYHEDLRRFNYSF